jgi:large subunit ribosomal protein L28
MSKVCDITGKRPRVGNKVSHANNKTKRRFYPNLQFKKFYVPETDSWIILRVSTSVIRTINKKGILEVIKDAQRKGTINQLLIG